LKLTIQFSQLTFIFQFNEFISAETKLIALGTITVVYGYFQVCIGNLLHIQLSISIIQSSKLSSAFFASDSEQLHHKGKGIAATIQFPLKIQI
jgi:hypothetical protein